MINKKQLIQRLGAYSFTPTLRQFISDQRIDVGRIYQDSCWTDLKVLAGKHPPYTENTTTKMISSGIRNLIHINSAAWIHSLQDLLSNSIEKPSSPIAQNSETITNPYKTTLYFALFRKTLDILSYTSIDQALSELCTYPYFKQEILELLDYILSKQSTGTIPLGANFPKELELYGNYTRGEIFTLLGKQTPQKKMQGHQAGTCYVEELNLELFFVTLNKEGDEHYTPSTSYEDYFIDEAIFHWQSPNNLSHSNQGRRYCQNSNDGRKFLLFIRKHRRDRQGRTQPFICMGPLEYVSSKGNYPMNILWKLLAPVPPQILNSLD